MEVGAVYAFWKLIGGGSISGLWDAFVNFVVNLFTWFFDPVLWIDVVFKILGWLLATVSVMLPEEIATPVAGFGDWLVSSPIQDAFKVGFFFLDPFCSAEILLAGLRAIILTWVFCLCLKALLWLKGHLWSASS